MFWEMAQDFQIPEWNQSLQQPSYASHWFGDCSSFYETGSNSLDTSTIQGNQYFNKSSFETTFGAHHFCR